MEKTTPISWPRMLTGHQGIYGRVSACFQHAIGASSLIKGYTSIRPDGVVIDRSVGQYCNSQLLHDTHDIRQIYNGGFQRNATHATQATQPRSLRII